MRYLKLLIGTALFFVLPFSLKSQQKQKHALIFAIGNYPPKGGWPMIAGIRDIVFVKSSLVNHGFQEGNIKVLQDSAVTPAAIETAFLELNRRVRPGDIAVIYFSTHGEQVEDDNNDEIDQYDESIVTFNARAPDPFDPSKNFDIYKTEYVRDDKIGSYLNHLRTILGKVGDVAVFMDMCHSGSGTKGLYTARGNKPPLVSSDFNSKKAFSNDAAGVFSEKFSPAEKEMAPIVIFSASRAEELDYETRDDENKPVGSFTYAFAKAFQKLESTTTYRSLFSKIQSEMNLKVPGQHPVLEGNGADRKLFGGEFISQKPYIEIESINAKKLVIKAGTLNGLENGTKVAVYPEGTSDPAKAIPLDSGRIIWSDMYKAEVSLSNGLTITQPALGWVFTTTVSYNIKPINVKIITAGQGTAGFTGLEANSIKTNLKALPLLHFADEPELLLIKGLRADSIKIASNGYLFDIIGNAVKDESQLQDKLQNYAQYKFFQSLELLDSIVGVEVTLVPLTNGIPDTGRLYSRNVFGTTEFMEGEKFVLWVKNPSQKPVYFNILDMQPDGLINAVLPNSRPSKGNPITPGELRLKPGESRLLDKYILTVGPPFGMEVYKIFTALEEINLEIIAFTRGQTPKGNFSVLERLVNNAFGVARRGTTGENLEGANGSIQNVSFIITPRK